MYMNRPSLREPTRKEQTHHRSSSFPSRKMASFFCFLLLLVLPVTIFFVHQQQILTTYASNTSLQLQVGYPSGIKHVFVIVMENRDWSQIKGNTTSAPYINSLLTRSDASYASNYHNVTP